MLVLVKTPAACLLIMIYMIGFYYRKPHIPIRSTKIFQGLIAVAVFNSSFDLITICTVNNRDVVPDSLNLAAHIIYLMSILGFVYLLFVYMRSYLETNLRFSKAVRILHSLPFVLIHNLPIAKTVIQNQNQINDQTSIQGIRLRPQRIIRCFSMNIGDG